MKKLILLFAVSSFLSSCNTQRDEPKPDAVRVIKDTLAETILRPFNERPKAEKIYVRVDTKEDVFLRKQDAMISGLLAEMKSRPQHFTISPTQPSEVEGEQGTKLAFNPNSFVNNDGKEILGAVDIELKECYKSSDLLRENIAGSTNTALMDSRGAIFVNATSMGQQVKLKPGEQINVRFPFSARAKDGYKFFYGHEEADGAMAWITAHNDNQQNDGAKEFTRPSFSYHGLGLQSYLHETITYPEEAKRNELSAKVEVSFLIDPTGKVTEVNTRESYKIFRNEIARVLNNMQGWQPATCNGKNIPAMVHVDIDFNIRRLDQVKVDFMETEASLVQTQGSCYMEYGKDIKSVDNKNTRSETLAQLGWCSCSREIHASKKMADIIIRADAKTEVRLILKNHNTITAGQNCVGYSRFRNIPLNAETFIMAIRYNKGQMEYALQPLKAEKQNIVSLAWKKGDEVSIQKAYRKLNMRS